jgi:nucleoside-diphosphate-sugar epimerase
MYILVIGGTGFIGSYVVRQLVEMGHTVTLFHRGTTQADLPTSVTHLVGARDQLPLFASVFRLHPPDVVLDMIPATERDAQIVIRTFRGIARRVVAISSMDVYRAYNVYWRREPEPLEQVPLTEDARLRQKLYPYRGTNASLEDYEKILVERVIMSESSLPGTVLRLPMVYGPGDQQHRWFEYLKRMDDQRPAVVLEAGRASWRGSWGYVENVAAAIALAVVHERAAGRIYNVTEPEILPMREWIARVGHVANWSGEIVVLPKEQAPSHLVRERNWNQHWFLDATRIRQELGYTERVPQKEALLQAIRWERAHAPSLIDPQLFDYAAEDRALAKP